MRLAISNLAWEKKDNDKLIKYLQTQGINFLEYTPYKLFLFHITILKISLLVFIKIFNCYVWTLIYNLRFYFHRLLVLNYFWIIFKFCTLIYNLRTFIDSLLVFNIFWIIFKSTINL